MENIAKQGLAGLRPFLGWMLVVSVLVLAGCDSGESNIATEAGSELSPAVVNFGERIIQADQEPQNWLSHGRNYEETRYSPLNQITTENIGQLGLQWSFDLDTENGQEATPLVVDGTMYVTSAWSKLYALDAVSGKLLWQFDPEVPKETQVKGCCDAVNRGAAYWDGKVYLATFDGRLIALSAETGEQVWSVLTVNQEMSYTITAAPRIAEGLVFIGNGGGEMGVRGYISAYDAQTGERVWRFYTVPGEPGKQDGEVSDAVYEKFAAGTWNGDFWNKSGGFGGGTVWDSMAYDPESGLLYFGVGNASYWNKQYRSNSDNDNLFVASIVAVKAKTGEYVWHYQHTPGDAWDYTSTQHMILATLNIEGQDRKVIMQAPKNGFFYVIDRTTGKVISAENYVPVNWADGIDLATGRPRIKDEAYYWKTNKDWLAMPSPFGGHNWHPMSFSKDTGLVYIPAQEIPAVYRPKVDFKPHKVGMNLGLDMRSAILPDDPETTKAIKNTLKGYLLAWDPIAQKEVWRAPYRGPWNGGVVSTGGNLVFEGDVDGVFNAYNATTGEQLWQFDSGNMISAAPATYSIAGKQYVTVLSGAGTAWSRLGGKMAWDDVGPLQNESRILTFALGGDKSISNKKRRLPKLAVMPKQFGSKEMIANGEKLYHDTCFACHGVGAIAESLSPPDLRYSGLITSGKAWESVVIDGVLTELGMVSFQDDFTAEEVEAIRAYVIHRANESLGK